MSASPRRPANLSSSSPPPKRPPPKRRCPPTPRNCRRIHRFASFSATTVSPCRNRAIPTAKVPVSSSARMATSSPTTTSSTAHPTSKSASKMAGSSPPNSSAPMTAPTSPSSRSKRLIYRPLISATAKTSKSANGPSPSARRTNLSTASLSASSAPRPGRRWMAARSPPLTTSKPTLPSTPATPAARSATSKAASSASTPSSAASIAASGSPSPATWRATPPTNSSATAGSSARGWVSASNRWRITRTSPTRSKT